MNLHSYNYLHFHFYKLLFIIVPYMYSKCNIKFGNFLSFVLHFVQKLYVYMYMYTYEAPMQEHLYCIP